MPASKRSSGKRPGSAAVRAFKSVGGKVGKGPGRTPRKAAVAGGKRIRDTRIRAGKNPNTGKGKGTVTGALRSARKQGLITRKQSARALKSLNSSGSRNTHVRLAGASSRGKRATMGVNLVRAGQRIRQGNRAAGRPTNYAASGSRTAKKRAARKK